VKKFNEFLRVLDGVIDASIPNHSTSEIDLLRVVSLFFIEIQNGISPGGDLEIGQIGGGRGLT
jgi:hypothetical protein